MNYSLLSIIHEKFKTDYVSLLKLGLILELNLDRARFFLFPVLELKPGPTGLMKGLGLYGLKISCCSKLHNNSAGERSLLVFLID